MTTAMAVVMAMEVVEVDEEVVLALVMAVVVMQLLLLLPLLLERHTIRSGQGKTERPVSR